MTSDAVEIDFGLDDILGEAPTGELEQWAAEQLSKPSNPDAKTGAVFDIETGALDEDALRAMYVEPTWEEFSVSCDQRWKEETKREKFEAAKTSGFHKFVDKAALDWSTGRVVAIGIQRLPGEPRILGSQTVSEATEATMLREFWAECKTWIDYQMAIVGHNIFSFDLPFLFMRSRLLRIDVPVGIVRLGGRYPDWNPKFCDTLVAAAFGDRSKFTGLNKLARFFNVGAKTEGVNGKDFARLWSEDDRIRTCNLRLRSRGSRFSRSPCVIRASES